VTALRSGEVATLAGVNVQTLRYYERRGLLAAPDRSPGGHRLYPPRVLTELRLIKATQRLGFTLEEVADLLAAGRHRHGGHARLAAKLGEVEARIADLEVVRDTLRAAVAAGCEDLATCADTPSCPLPLHGDHG
jgi:MerR family mercuric resistance operon transcriptional regulator